MRYPLSQDVRAAMVQAVLLGATYAEVAERWAVTPAVVRHRVCGWCFTRNPAAYVLLLAGRHSRWAPVQRLRQDARWFGVLSAAPEV